MKMFLIILGVLALSVLLAELVLAANPDQPTLNYPLDNATGVEIVPKLNVTVTDPDGDNMNVTFCNWDGVACLALKIDEVANGSDATYSWNLLSGVTEEWLVTISDGAGTTTSDVWNFTTIMQPRQPSSNYPGHNARDIGLNPTLNVSIEDPDGDSANASFYLVNNTDDDTEDAYECIGTFSVGSPCTDAVDEDQATFALPLNYLNESITILENYTIQNPASDATIETTFNRAATPNNYAELHVWNYTASDWDLIDNQTPVTTMTYSNSISHLVTDYLNTTLQTKVVTYKTRYFESLVEWHNVSLLGIDTNVANSTDAEFYLTGLGVNFVYSWYVNITDEDGSIMTMNYTFTTVPANNLATVGVTIYPQPPLVNSNLTCNITVEDDEDLNFSTEYWWYNSTVEMFSGNTTGIGFNTTTLVSTLGSGNTSMNDEWNCTVRVWDGTNYSLYYSDITVINDSTAPQFGNWSLSSTEGFSDVAFTISADCNDAITSLDFVYAEVTDPNSAVFNHSMTLSSGTTYTKSYTPGTVGVYSFKFYCEDESGNLASNTSTGLAFTSESRPTAGGGGGGAVVYDESNLTAIIVWDVPIAYFLVVGTPSTQQKKIKVSNIGNTLFLGDLSLTEDIEYYLDAIICDIDMLDCDVNSVQIKAGETKLLVLSAVFDETLGEGVEGIITLESDKAFELKTSIERPPGAYFKIGDKNFGYVALSEVLGWSEGLSLVVWMLMFLGIVGGSIFGIMELGGMGL